MPDITFDTKEAIPEGLQESAAEVNGKWVVKVVPAAKLDEFRANNITIATERDRFRAFHDGISPLLGELDVPTFTATFKTLKEMEQKVKDGTLTAKGDIEAEVTRRVSGMKEQFDRQNQDMATRLTNAEAGKQEAESRWKNSIVDRHVTDAVLNEKSGAIPAALQDILARGRSIFRVGDEGKITAKDGEAVIYGADGATPMTPLEWLARIRPDAPHFFKGSSGGGSTNGTGSGDARLGGMTQADFSKLPPQQRLALVRKNEGKA